MSLRMPITDPPTLSISTSDSAGIGESFVSEGRANATPRVDGTSSFLEDMKEESLSTGFPSYTVVDRAITLWMDLRQRLWAHGIEEEVSEPTIGLNRSGDILFSWRLDSGYLECEVLESGSEVFYENLDTGEVKFEELDHVGAAEANWLIKRLANSL